MLLADFDLIFRTPRASNLLPSSESRHPHCQTSLLSQYCFSPRRFARYLKLSAVIDLNFRFYGLLWQLATRNSTSYSVQPIIEHECQCFVLLLLLLLLLLLFGLLMFVVLHCVDAALLPECHVQRCVGATLLYCMVRPAASAFA